MRFGIDLDEEQIRAATLVADALGLRVEEAVEHIVLLGLQEATLAYTRRGLSMEEVQRALNEHSARIVAELKLRRGGNGRSGLVRP